MNLLDELNNKLDVIENKLKSQEQLEQDDIKVLFLKALIEEETGNVSSTK